MNIGLDVMGGDFAPLEAVKGLQLYLSSSPSPANIYCFGHEATILSLFAEYGLSSPHIFIVHAPEIISMHEHPTRALKEKRQSSIAEGFNKLAPGEIDAFVSAGNTGAMLVGAFHSIKSIPGVLRPAISTIVPQVNGASSILVDVGLNSDCKPEYLNQFAILGSLYAQRILDIANPKVGLLNMGEEEGKGNLLAQEAYQLLKDNPQINFIGNIEGRDVFMNKADVMVCDGYTGNIVLKMAESLYEVDEIRNLNDHFMRRFDFENVGGTPVLGVAKPVIIGHGISRSRAFCNMILLAEKMIAKEICHSIVASFKN